MDEDDDQDGVLFTPIEKNLADHHRLLLNKLETTSETPYGRLLVMMPPGSAKSTYGSVVFPSRYLGKTPNRRLILGSYGDDLARKMGRRTRGIIKQPRYKGIWGCELSPDSAAAQEFALTNGSEYMAAGLTSGITGNRAHGLIIDDPIKGREAAESQVQRDKVWDTFYDDGLSRLLPGGWAVMIMTRWNEDDPAGRILPEGWKGESGKFIGRTDGLEWDVLCLQALCETDTDPLGRKRGEYLWPEWFGDKHWSQFRNSTRTWNSLFQQRPAPLDGDFFKPAMMPVIDAIPVGTTKFVRGWDFAATQDDGDWTVGAKIGLMPDGRWLIADIVRIQGSPDEVVATLKNTAALDGRSVSQDIPQDPGQAGKSQVAFMAKQLAGFTVSSSTESGDKVTRAEPLASQVNVGNVVMLRGAWNSGLMNEMRAFPNGGAKDDQVDACSRSFNAKRIGAAKVTELRI